MTSPLTAPPEWMDSALCAQTDPDEFFPEMGGSTHAAKKVCGACEVRAECLQWALERDERYGVWGGLSERERRKLRTTKSLYPGRVVQPINHGTEYGYKRCSKETPGGACVACLEGYAEVKRERDAARQRKARDPQLDAAVQGLRGRGLSIGEMAEQLGVTLTRVRQALAQGRAA